MTNRSTTRKNSLVAGLTPTSPRGCQLIPYEIIRLAKGGYGVSKAMGKTFFIEGALPGETGKAEILEEKKNFGIARAVSRDCDAPIRNLCDACPVSDRCGGCGFRHVKSECALKLKAEAVSAEIFKLSHLDPIEPILHPVISHDNALDGLRQRIRLHLNRSGIGYFAHDSHTIVPAGSCAVIDPVLREVVQKLEKIPRPPLGFCCELQIDLDDQKRAFLHIKPSDNVQMRANKGFAKPAVWLHQLIQSGLFAGIRFDKEPIDGDAMIRDVVSLDGMPDVYYWRRIGDFGQATRQANAHLHRIVADFLKQTHAQEVADLFAGSGNFTFRAAQFAKVVHAYEFFCDTEAFERGWSQNQANAVPNAHVELQRFDLTRGLPKTAFHCDAAICDPAREGLSDKMCCDLKQSKIRDLLYISCEATNLARDLARLKSSFQLKSLQFVDMFPMTPHVETVAWLTAMSNAECGIALNAECGIVLN